MHTIERFEQALVAAARLGYQIRYEYLGGSGGGACEFGGKKWLFIDLALTADEQLEHVIDALRGDPRVHQTELTPQFRESLGLPKAA